MNVKSRINLNNTKKYGEIDKQNLLKVTETFPEQCEKALNICKKISLKPFVPSNIMIFGMGGSGIGGKLLEVLMNDRLNIPLSSFNHYDIPAYSGEKTLAFMVSYSGNTEETIKAYDKIKRSGAKIVGITSGGALLEKIKKDNMEYVKVPEGYQPRAALGFLFLPLIYSLYKKGIIDEPEEEIRGAIELLKKERDKLSRNIPEEENPAKKLAVKIFGTTPLIYGSRYYLETVARRWRCQLNENAKILAYSDIFPELCHNTICGWDRMSPSENYTVIMLRAEEEDASIKTRTAYLKEIIEEKECFVEEVTAAGKSKLEKILWAVYFVDFVSIYLALLRGVNPSDIERINTLKSRLRD